MTVSMLGDTSLRRTYPPPRRRLHHSPGHTAHPVTEPSTPTVTIRVEVTISGDNSYADTLDVLAGLRQLADEFDPSRVRVLTADATEAATAAEPAATDDATVRVFSARRSVQVGRAPVELTRREFDLLHFLAENPRRVFTRDQLLASVWGDLHTGGRTIDVHIRRLRVKLGIPLVTTIRGVGYRLADDARVQVWSA
jgi:hypothetical protein